MDYRTTIGRGFLGAALALATSGAAHASTTFLFAGPLGVDSSFVFSEDGISVTATGSNTSGPPHVLQGPLGLRVVSAIFDSVELDGFGPDETLTLTFGQPVMIEHALFSLVSGNDDIRIEADNGVFDVDDPDALLGFSFTSFTPAPTGGVFGFTVQGNNDDYALKALKVKPVTDPTNGKIIPTPSAALGGMAMLAAAGAWRTRRRSDLA